MIGKKWIYWISLVAQWLRIHLPLQGSWAQILVQEDSTSRGATAHAPQLLNPCAATTEALSLEPVLHHHKSRHNVKPTHCNEAWPPLATTREKPTCSNGDPTQLKIKEKWIYLERNTLHKQSVGHLRRESS